VPIPEALRVLTTIRDLVRWGASEFEREQLSFGHGFATALDERITSAVVSGYFNTFRDSIMAVRHCLCNFVPGIVKTAEMVDIAGLVAPRPLMIETGTRDPLFPTAATQQAYAQLQKIYAVFSAADKLDIDVFEGEHAWSGAKAYDWLSLWM
jgi:hypothetical protein